MTIRDITIKILPILKGQHVEKAAIFGSFARGTEKRKSDIDLLIKLHRSQSLFDLVELKMKLEQKLGRKVDLITYNSLNQYLKKEILDEQKIIYEKF